jgi:hypothetical protein
LREEVGREDGIEGLGVLGERVLGEDELELTKEVSVRRAPEAVVSDLVEAFGEHMLKEATDELVGGEGHEVPLGCGGVLIAEGDLAVIGGNESAVADGDTMDIAPQVG